VGALAADCAGPGAVALDQAVGTDAGELLNVVDVLCVVGQELVLVLKKLDESMSG